MALAKKKKILIIDDDNSLSELYNDKFSREGFSVREAKNGKEGLEAALKERPDLVLLDILMPVMDGITMLKKLREDDWGKDVPVILLTNLDDTDKVAEAASEGVYDYLVKQDYRIEDLVKKVKDKLNL
jgi:DNA-binding response OmpR family regulator